jgi:hypothetical protein
MIKIIKKTIAELYIEDSILVIRYLERVRIDLESSIQLMQDRELLSAGESYPVLADGRKALYWTKDSRKFMAGSLNNKYITSIAILITSPIHRILVNFYLNINNPSVPTRFFNSEAEAINWLKKYTSGAGRIGIH